MDKTVTALVQELKKLSTEVADDKDLANVAAVSAGVWWCGGWCVCVCGVVAAGGCYMFDVVCMLCVGRGKCGEGLVTAVY
jgi:hypothetical protein